MDYAYKKTIALPFNDAVKKTKEALIAQGFGILSETNVQETLKTKLSVDYPNYVILGVCNPELSYKALQAEKEIGLFLPCKAIVYEEKGNVNVSVLLPGVIEKMIGSEKLKAVFSEAEEKLKNAIGTV